MFKIRILAGAALTLAYAQGAQAQSGAHELESLLRKVEELEQKDARKEKQIEDLQHRLEIVQQPAATTAIPATDKSPGGEMPVSAGAPQPMLASPVAPAGGPVTSPGLTPYQIPGLGGSDTVTSGTAFNPAISVILDGAYYNDDRSGRAGEIIESASGVHNAPGEAHGSELARGFNLRETEAAFSASVDKYLDAMAILAIGGDGLEVEEAYGRTRSLPWGLQAKFGKFFSGIGYLNQQHPHQWDFTDQALPYQVLFGGGLKDAGLQLTWLPDLPVYTLFGVEALQGENAGVASVIGPTSIETSTPVPLAESKAGPRLFTGFLKVAPDLGYNHALQAGLFGGVSRQHQEAGTLYGQDGYQAQQGRAWFLGTDWVYKYDSPKAYGQGDLTLQGEYLYQAKNLSLVFDEADPGLVGQSRKTWEDGFYVQGVYGFWPRWTAGLRYDRVGLTNRVRLAEAPTLSFDDSRRLSANLTFNPTEFSRLRLQYSNGDFAAVNARERFNQVFLQYQLSLGVHGAHKF